MSRQRQDATDTFVHYFRILFEKNGWRWTADNHAEIETAVEAIITAAVLTAKDAP